jgi:hypothetical protein
MWTPPQRSAVNDLSPLALLMQRFGAAHPPGELPRASQALLRDLPDHLPCGVLRADHPHTLERIATQRHNARALAELFEQWLLSGPDQRPGQRPAMGLEALMELTDLRDHLLGLLRARDGGPVSVWDSLHRLS